MFELTYRWSAEALCSASEQDAIDDAFRSGDLSGLADLRTQTIERAEQTYLRAAQRNRAECEGAAALLDNADLSGVSEWISATRELIQRQERFAADLAGLAPAPTGTPIPLGKRTVNSAS